MYMPVIRYIGIDFGTSTTVVRIKDFNEYGPVKAGPPDALLEPTTGEVLIQSLVFEPESPNYPTVYGNAAENQNIKGTLHRNFKMLLESNDENKVELAKRLIAGFLKWIRKLYLEQKDSRFGPCDVEKTFISYPVKWSDSSMKIMEKLTQEAGFKNVMGINEPLAAIHGILIEDLQELQDQKIIKPNVPFTVLLIDMGAGTTDLVLFKSIVKDKEVSVDIITTWPPAGNEFNFGGREVESILCEAILNEIIPYDLMSKDDEKQKRRLNSYLKDFKLWKEHNLSPTLNENRALYAPPMCISPYMDILDISPSEFKPLDRKRFEKIMGNYMEQFPKLVNDCLDYACRHKKGIESNYDIDLVILTGGHCQWYFVEEMLLNKQKSPMGQQIRLPKLIQENIRLRRMKFPQETVAKGMAYKGFPINIRAVAANSVWLSLEIGITRIPPLLLIEKDTLLPATKRIEFNKTIRAEFSTDMDAPNGMNNNYALQCRSIMYVGETLETAQTRKLELEIENYNFGMVIKDIIACFRNEKTFYKDYNAKIIINTKVNDQQGIDINGEITYGYNKRLTFKY